MAVAALNWPLRCGCVTFPRHPWVGFQALIQVSLFAFDPTSQLLEYEPRSGEQVPLLLKMKRSKLALSKAIESGDTDLGEQGWVRTRRHLDDKVSEPSKVQSWAGGPPASSSTVFTVLLHLKNELNRGDFFMTLRNQPMALSLYRQVNVCQGEERVGAF